MKKLSCLLYIISSLVLKETSYNTTGSNTNSHYREGSDLLYSLLQWDLDPCSLTKIRVLTVTGSSLKQRMWGMVLSYQAVTTTRISHDVFVSFNKEGKEWCYLFRLAPKLV